MTRHEMYRKRRNWWAWMVTITALIAFALSQMGCAEFHATSVKFSKKAKIKLDLGYTAYVDSLGVEFAFCCYGYSKGDTLYIKDVEIMWGFHYPNGLRAYADYCTRKPIIWGHAHPRGHMFPSGVDMQTLKRTGYPLAVIITKVGDTMVTISYRRGYATDALVSHH